ncbi:MAG: response regulator [Caulobacterales bacterium]|nr:response regulator [Caulobacterales bacterium]
MSEGQSIGGGAERRPVPGRASHSSLLGFQVFLVEDEVLVAAIVEDMLAEFGCVLAGAAASVDEALTALQTAPDLDAAILDVNLGGEKVYPVADLLARRGVPLVFSTGYGPADLALRYPTCRLLHKPYRPEALAQVLVEFARGPLC